MLKGVSGRKGQLQIEVLDLTLRGRPRLVDNLLREAKP
jgi:hypothetical protein